MPFGLTNALVIFQQEMNDMFRDQVEQFIIVFLVDIFIYNYTLDEHGKRVCFVLQTLRDKQFYAKISKCEFFK